MKINMRLWIAAGLVAGMPAMSLAQAPAQPAGGAQAGGAQAAPAQAGDRPAGDVPGPIDNLNDVQDTGRMLFKMADTNNDGQISQKEAVDAANLMVGGFFFRADQNGDGVLTQDEARQAREAMFAQQPLLRYVFQKGKQEVQNQANAGNANENNKAAANIAANPVGSLGGLLDTNNDKQIQASEVRSAVNSAVQGMFAVADTNRDNQLSPTEINAAIIGAARTAAQAAFTQADGDRNGSLSRAEFDKAIVEPANVVFSILDVNSDGQISQQEAEQARRILGSQIRHLMVPEPANSARNLLRTGVSPDQIAPVPGSTGAAAPRR